MLTTLCFFLLSSSTCRSALLNARSQMAGRKYPFSSFLPRFWLQEIVEELDNTTSTAAAGASSGDLVRPRVDKSFAHPTPLTGLLAAQARQSLDQDAANDLLDNVAGGLDRPVLSRFRAQSPLDRLGLRTQLDDDRREPAQQRLDQAPAQAAGDGAGRPALPIDGAAWLQTVRARTRADVYGAFESITCAKLDQLVFDSQRPFSHVRSCFATVCASSHTMCRWAKRVFGTPVFTASRWWSRSPSPFASVHFVAVVALFSQQHTGAQKDGLRV
jgi:hypothetical protein